jgi:F-type H+-transporting ATPase subunit b
MSGLFGQLGIDWRLLLGQGVNFFILLLLLSALVYRPLVRILDQRRRTIEKGLSDAARAVEELQSVEKVSAKRLAQADAQALTIVEAANRKGQERLEELHAEAEKKAEVTLASAKKIAEQQRIEALGKVKAEARGLMAAALARAVEIRPDQVDE